GLALELLAAKVLAIMAAPVMPNFAAELWQGLGYGEPLGTDAWGRATEWVPSGQALGALDKNYFNPLVATGEPVLAAS
ncbi:MAG: hypothetical protein HC897_14240, partial [Thermoanaerobaculia bacterium]|nr:hypothetical protein [Thermoanaerobaculia bacterium]